LTARTDPGRGAIGAIAHPKTNESYFIYHDFVQFGKQSGTLERECITRALPPCPLKGGATGARSPYMTVS